MTIAAGVVMIVSGIVAGTLVMRNRLKERLVTPPILIFLALEWTGLLTVLSITVRR